MKKIICALIGWLITLWGITSCKNLLESEPNCIPYRVRNNTDFKVEFSFFYHKMNNADNITCFVIGHEPIMPNDSTHGGFIYDNGREQNSWVDYFNTEKIDTFYVIISATPIEAKEGQKYDALPKGSNVLKIYKYTKESFYDFNPETDVVTFVYP
ncbi:MAG: hypothetical protein IJJ78_02555 [Paludibacteraceae bacterium]|nr:hypothetical protein [Paludibacteraceae bacterium]